MNNKDYLYRIKEFPFFQYLAKLILLSWIYFAYTKFEENPIFFGLMIAIAIIIILVITETSIVATKECLIIKHNRWIPILNKTKKFNYSEIVDITYERGKISGLAVLLNLIEYTPGTIKRNARISIQIKDKSSIEIATVGNQSENEKLIKIVKREINKTTYNNK